LKESDGELRRSCLRRQPACLQPCARLVILGSYAAWFTCYLHRAMAHTTHFRKSFPNDRTTNLKRKGIGPRLNQDRLVVNPHENFSHSAQVYLCRILFDQASGPACSFKKRARRRLKIWMCACAPNVWHRDAARLGRCRHKAGWAAAGTLLGSPATITGLWRTRDFARICRRENLPRSRIVPYLVKI